MIIYIPIILMAYIGGYTIYKINKPLGVLIPVIFIVLIYVYIVMVGDLNV